MSEEITLHVDLPEVVEVPLRLAVRCGTTECEVSEHGVAGSGDWAARMSRGHVIAGGTKGFPIEQALEAARAYVRREERARLMRNQLVRALEKREVPDGSDG